MKKNNLLLTGGFGFLGRAVHKKLSHKYNIFRFRSSEYDLRDYNQVIELFKNKKFDYVIHAAARLGGIGDNQKNPALYFYDNISMGINILKCACDNKIKKLINIGTVCSYPLHTPKPFDEKNLWNGLPEPTNSAYGLSKRAVISYSYSLYKQYGFNCVNLLLSNLYGINDDFRDETSHVIPALIKKMYFAKKDQKEEIIVWGDGSPTRDFLNTTDAANSILCALQSDYNIPDPINIASGQEISIKQLIKLIKKNINYEGKIKFDTSKPNGQPYRLLNISKARELINFNPKINLEEGVKEVVSFFNQNKSEILKQKKKYSD